MAVLGRYVWIHKNTWEQSLCDCTTKISAEVSWGFPKSRFIVLNSVLSTYCLSGIPHISTRGCRVDLDYAHLLSWAKRFLGIFLFQKQ